MKVRLQLIALLLPILVIAGCSEPAPAREALAPTPDEVVEVFSDLVYVEPLQTYVLSQELDVYKPVLPGTWPVIVFLHGLGATKEGYAKESSAIAEQGAVVFTPNWPVATADIAAQENGEGFREIYQVLVCAIRFARNYATDYGGDPSNLTLIGHSFGAAYGSRIALAGDDIDSLWEQFATEREAPQSQVKCVVSEGSSNVDAYIGIGGRYNFAEKLQESDPKLWKIVSPFAHIGQGPKLPVRLLHGESDRVVDLSISVLLNDRLSESSYDTSLTTFDGGHIVPIDLTIETLFDLEGE